MQRSEAIDTEPEFFLAQAYREAKLHLTANQLQKYSVKKDQLTLSEKKKIEDHLNSCTRCKKQVGIF